MKQVSPQSGWQDSVGSMKTLLMTLMVLVM
jgi:hypothetical protein